MTDNPIIPSPSRRLRGGILITTMLVVGMVAAGCGATEPASQGLVPARPGSEQLPDAEHGDPPKAARPTVRNLDPDLLAAVRASARDARDDGVRLVITSGWRSRTHQQRLFDEAVVEHGGEDEARRYVSTPDDSAHVTGDAVDIGPTEADYWLIQHGAAHGLCQVFANEVWHFELAMTFGGGCPDLLPDSSHRS